LIAKGELMGAMLIAQREGFEPLTDRKVELVSGIANQAALAIEGTQLWISQQEEAWVTTALLSVAESVNSTLDLEQTLITLTRLTPMLIGIAHCAILQWNPHQKEFSGGAVFGLDAEKERQFMAIALLPTHDDLAAELIATENPISAGRGQAHPLPLVIEAIFGSDPLWFLPLVAKGNMVGCMIVDHLVEGEQITQRRMNILTGIAHQSALALETARLQEESMERQRLERELEVAANIQHSFLPNQLPQLEGWGLAAYYRAARQVGGDFYDFIPIRGGKWGIVIADVADKGVPAALFMALSRTNIRAAAYSRTSPAETLARVNELLLADSRSDLFVTVWYGVWDPTTGEIAYACTGHNPPLLVRATGETLELSAKGIALNVIETIVLEEKTVTLQVGDVLIAYTDGLTDAMRNDQVEFGVSGLRQVAGTLRDRSATDIKTQIINAVDEFTEDLSPFDDLTLVVLKNENAVVAPAELLSAQTND
jgi:serine phosphatase RsbU (regulator of sigma subunit)